MTFFFLSIECGSTNKILFFRSTDQHPQHHLCPQGADSWCKFNRAQAEEKSGFKHTSSLPTAVMDAIKPVFVDLTKDELLKRCVDGMTQNPNESINNLIWKTAPKNAFCQRTKVEVATYEAVLTFNDGQKSKFVVLERLGITPGKNLVKWANAVDIVRIKKAQEQAQLATKEARKARRQAGKDQQERLEDEEGSTYEAGNF